MEQTYREQIQAIFGTDDLEQLRRIAQRLPLERNPRRAGRKGFFTPEQQVKLLEEYSTSIHGVGECSRSLLQRHTQR